MAINFLNMFSFRWLNRYSTSFKIHRKMIFGNPSIIVQNMLRIAPKTLNAVDMIAGAFVHHVFAVGNGMVFAQPFERAIAPEGVGIIHRPLARFLSDNCHKIIRAYSLYHSRIYLPITLQKPKYNAFTSRSSSSLTLASPAKVRLVHLYSALQCSTFQFGYMIQSFAKVLIDAGYGLIIKGKIVREAVSWLLRIKALDDLNLAAQLFQSFVFAAAAFHIPPTRPVYFERTAENALSSSHKVGRTTENTLSTCNHKGIVALHGCDSH